MATVNKQMRRSSNPYFYGIPLRCLSHENWLSQDTMARDTGLDIVDLGTAMQDRAVWKGIVNGVTTKHREAEWWWWWWYICLMDSAKMNCQAQHIKKTMLAADLVFQYNNSTLCQWRTWAQEGTKNYSLGVISYPIVMQKMFTVVIKLNPFCKQFLVKHWLGILYDSFVLVDLPDLQTRQEQIDVSSA